MFGSCLSAQVACVFARLFNSINVCCRPLQRHTVVSVDMHFSVCTTKGH